MVDDLMEVAVFAGRALQSYRAKQNASALKELKIVTKGMAMAGQRSSVAIWELGKNPENAVRTLRLAAKSVKAVTS